VVVTRPALPPLPEIPWWARASAVVAPVALAGGWWWAGAIPARYDPVHSTISDLAAAEAPTHWLMTTALVVTGVAYVITAVGMRPADVTGRAILAAGGVATLLTAWIPNAAAGHNSAGHMISAYLAFLTLSVWPSVIARNRPDAPLVLRPRFGQVVSVVLLALVLLTIADIVTDGATLGLRERLLATAQSVAPLVVLVGIVMETRVPGRRFLGQPPELS
jgi:hypothetical membrane protein